LKNSVAPATGNHFDLQPGSTVGLARQMPPVSAGLTADLPESRPAWKRFCLRSLVLLWLFVMIMWPSYPRQLSVQIARQQLIDMTWRQNSIQSDIG
jgi:hypothetical protein